MRVLRGGGGGSCRGGSRCRAVKSRMPVVGGARRRERRKAPARRHEVQGLRSGQELVVDMLFLSNN